MPPTFSMRLPPERGEQLRDLARHYGLPLTDTVGILLDFAAEHGLYNLMLPGLEVACIGDHVTLFINGEQIDSKWSARAARIQAQSLLELIDGDESLDNNDEIQLSLTRTGRAVVIKATNTLGFPVQKVVAHTVARCLAAQFNKAAEVLENAQRS